jgi:hypothetical protein
MKTRFVILVALAIAGLAVFAATDARAACLQTGPNGCERFETAGGWVMALDFFKFCDGTDTSPECLNKQGKPITGYGIGYSATAPESGYNLVQANVLVEDCGDADRISMIYPPSVKIDAEDSNSTYGAGSPDYVLQWDSLKLDESNHAYFAAYTTRAGLGPQGALLKTGDGYEYVDEIVGPVCCEQTQVATQISVDGTTVNYDSCTGDFNGVITSTGTGVSAAAGASAASLPADLEQISGLYVCATPLGAEDVDKNQCHTVKKIGGGLGGLIEVMDVSLPAAPDTYSGYRFYGYGNKFYKQEVTDQPFPPGGDPPTCDGETPALVPNRTVFNNGVALRYSSDGFICDMTSADGTVQGTLLQLWFFEATDGNGNGGGKMSDIGGPLVNSGMHGGVVIDGSIYGAYGGWGWGLPTYY